MNDFYIYYTYPYKGFFEKKAKKFTEMDDRGLARGIAEFLENIEGAIVFSGIDVEGVRNYVKELGEGVEEKLLNAKLKKAKEEFSNKKELFPVVETAIIFYSLKESGLSPFPSPYEIKGEFKEEDFEEKKGIGVMLKYSDWVVIKKLSFEGAEDFMVAGIIAGIADSLTKRLYPLLGFENPKKKKRDWKKMAKELGSIKGEGIEKSYQVYKTIIENGYFPYPTLEILAKAYPMLKPKKPRGRFKG